MCLMLKPLPSKTAGRAKTTEHITPYVNLIDHKAPPLHGSPFGTAVLKLIKGTLTQELFYHMK